MSQTWRSVIYLVTFILLLFAASRDKKYERLYPDDLRNRVVGARLIYDGQSPYFYKWQPEDGMRYYDPENFSNTAISNTTASPFLHELLLPFCNLSQRTISKMWLFGQYLIIWLMAWIAAWHSKQRMVWIVIALFLYTDGWVRHILTGQFYLLVPFLLLLIYILLVRKKSPWIAAALAVMVVLIRPFAGLLFIPVLFILPQTRKFIIACFALGAAYAIFVLASPFQRELYKDYNKFIKYSVSVHQNEIMAPWEISPNPGYDSLEGFDIKAIRSSKARDGIQSRNEHGNFFVIYKRVFNEQLPLGWLLIGSLLSTLLIILIFYYGTAHGNRSLYQCMLAGFVIYMVLEMFLPMHRHQYNSVQFLFPLLLVAMNERYKNLILIGVGLLLNIINWEIFPMKNTIGELLMLAGFMLIVIRPRGNPAQY